MNIQAKYFSSTDHDFASNTLKKLNIELNSLHKRYEKIDSYVSNPKEPFDKMFIKKITLFEDLEQQRSELQNLDHLDEDDKEDLKIINDTYKKGTGIMFFYWDSDSRDFLAKSGGKLKATHIDEAIFCLWQTRLICDSAHLIFLQFP